MKALEKIDYKGYTIKVYTDDDPQNPIEDDGNAKYCLSHRRYDLQNDTDIQFRDYGNWEQVREAIEEQYAPFAILPVFMYDHSGITIRTEPFGDRWDSGQIGYVFVDLPTLKQWGFDSPEAYEKSAKRTLEEDMRNNVKLYDDYLSGQVYGFKLFDPKGEEIDSCWGYFGDWANMVKEVRGSVDYYVNQDRKSHFEALKKWIRSKVPYQYRKPLVLA